VLQQRAPPIPQKWLAVHRCMWGAHLHRVDRHLLHEISPPRFPGQQKPKTFELGVDPKLCHAETLLASALGEFRPPTFLTRPFNSSSMRLQFASSGGYSFLLRRRKCAAALTAP
jgi:hypothetical protein